MNSATAICDAVVAAARAGFAKARLEASRRPIGTLAVDVDFYDQAEAKRPVEDIRWCAWLVRWTGKEWRRVRRVSGPGDLSHALDKAGEQAKRRGIERVG